MLPGMTVPGSKQLERGGLLGVGLDASDGHRRVTTGRDFVLVGGSHDTHARMQDLVVRMSETLERQGRCFAELTHGEFEDLARSSLK
jgi:hypothetical protein